MEKPLIGVLPQFSTKENRIISSKEYTKVIKEAGGVPVILPLYNSVHDLGNLLNMLGGVLFTGGPDINPLLYGEETHLNCGNIIPERDQLELHLMKELVQRKLPILGICRGIQVMAVAFGGTLIQDIKSETSSKIAHYQEASNEVVTHHVNIYSNSFLAHLIKQSKVAVNSFHHQAIKSLGSQLTISATSEDGMIEAVELKEYPFFLGVQWHPEMLYENDANSRCIFKEFVNVARR